MKIVDKPVTQENVLKLFNCVVVEPHELTGQYDNSLLANYSIITNFAMSREVKWMLEKNSLPIAVKTLFGVKERANSSAIDLIMKQLYHYVEVYGLDQPGLFNLEVTKGEIVRLTYVQGITRDQLVTKIEKLIRANAPIKDIDCAKGIINDFKIEYDINDVANNELRVALFDESKHAFADGDDAVRYMCFKATGSPMLIKSKEVIKAITDTPLGNRFFEGHQIPLSKVFNRHKPLILASKNVDTKTTINKITRLSKTNHVPIREPISKRIVSMLLAGTAGSKELALISLRDKFKILNLLEYKKMGHDIDAFIIRNGKIHIEDQRRVDTAKLQGPIDEVLSSIAQDLKHLAGKTILLDESVDYGLPVSRKQTLGNLPFGTQVTIAQGNISSGVHWRNEWGCQDLDLSVINSTGERTGWGQYSGYNNRNPITFSGDVTDAFAGAMEFMTSTGSEYGLFVNNFRGENECEFEVVVGRAGKNKWIKDTAIREKIHMKSRGNVIGFVKGNTFVAYQGRLDDSRASGDIRNIAIVLRGSSEFWTVRKLFDKLNIKYVVDKQDDVCYDYNMRYESFSYDKLEELLLPT